MSAITTISEVLRTKNIGHYLVALVLSTLMLDYAYASICLGLFFTYTILDFIVNKERRLNLDVKLFLPVLLFLWFAATYFWSIDKDLTLKGIGRMLSLILVPIGFFLVPKFSKKEFVIVMQIFTISNFIFGSLFLVLSFIRYIKTENFNEFSYHNLVLDFELNAIYVSAFYSISFIYLLTKKKKSSFDVFCLIFFFTLIILLSSKTILFCLLFASFIIGINKLKNSRIKIVEIIWALIILCLIGFFATKEISRRVKEEFSHVNSYEKSSLLQVLEKKEFSKVYPWTGASIRLFQLRLLKEQIEDEHILSSGFGLFASRVDLEKRHIKYGTYNGFHNYNYHNLYAQVLSETGVLGFFLLLVVLSMNFISAIKSTNLLFLFFSFLVPVWSFTESILWVQRGLFFFIILFCLFNRVNFKENLNFDKHV